MAFLEVAFKWLMPDDVNELANAVAEELAVEHCSFYGDKTSKAAKDFFLNQLYRFWRHTSHQSVEYPQWVISIQRTKAKGHVFPFSSIHPITYVANNAVVLGCARTSSLSECAHQLCASKQ